MKKTNLFFAITAATVGALANFHSAAQSPAEPLELENLRKSWQTARNQALAPVDEKYKRALEEMRTRFTTAGKLQDALAVDNEIKALNPNSSGTVAAQPQATPTREDVINKLIGVKLTINFNSGSEPGGNGPITIGFDKGGKLSFQVGSQKHDRTYTVNDNGTISVDPTSNGTRSWTLRLNKDLSAGSVDSSSGARGRCQIVR